MLVAQKSDGSLIALTKHQTKDQLALLKTADTLCCPTCQEPVTLKLGRMRTPHFAHLKGAECTGQSEGESAYHLHGKQALFQWLNTQYEQVELETYLKRIKQRPDLLFTHRNKTFALEYQCATIALEQFQKRTNAYLKENIEPIWLIGGKRLHQRQHHVLQLTSFDWLCLRYLNQSPLLLYYCPNTSLFLKATHLTPFSAQSVFAQLTYYDQHDVTFPALLEATTIDLQQLHSFWLAKKRTWRMYAHKNVPNPLQRSWRNKGLTTGPALIPAEAGIPLPSLAKVRTPAVYWQTSFLLHFIHPLKIGDWFTVPSYAYFEPRVLPFVQQVSQRELIMEYLTELELQGTIKKLSETRFVKTSELMFPRTIAEAAILDHEILGKRR